MEKKSQWNWDIINKNIHSTFHTGKTGNFNSEFLLPWNWLKMRVIAKKSIAVINIIQMICIGHVLEAPGPKQKILLWKLEWKTAERFYNHHRNKKLPSKKATSNAIYRNIICICLWSNNQVLSKFYYLLIFSPFFN